jgi:hypothetical protein
MDLPGNKVANASVQEAVLYQRKLQAVTFVMVRLRIICILQYAKCVKFVSYLSWQPVGNFTFQLGTQNARKMSYL